MNENYLDKLVSRREEAQKRKVEEDDLAKIVGSVDKLRQVQLASTKAQLRASQNPVTLRNPGASTKDVDQLTNVVADLTIASHVNQTKTVKQLEDLNELIKELPKQYPEIPAFPELPVPPDAVSIINFKEVTDWLQKVVTTLSGLKLDPKIEVKPAQVNVAAPVVQPPDFAPLLKAIKALDIKAPVVNIPDNSKSFEDLEKAITDTKKAIMSLSFPVPNFILPFRDTTGKATQVQLDADGKVPTSGGAGGGDASAANQTNGAQKSQIVDAGGEAATITGGKLDVNASVDTTGLALDATLTDKSQFTKLTDGTDTLPIGPITAASGTTSTTGAVLLAVAPGTSVRLYHVSYVPTSSATADIDVTILIGATTINGWRTNFNGGGYMRSPKGGQGWFLGGDGEDITITLSAAQPVRWNIEYEII